VVSSEGGSSNVNNSLNESKLFVDTLNLSNYFNEVINPIVSKFDQNADHQSLEMSHELNYRVNPLAQILVNDDIQKLASCGLINTESISLVVHCGFGNEALESLSRVVVIMHNDYEHILQKFIKIYNKSKVLRLSRYSQVALSSSSSIAFSVSDIVKSKKRKLKKSDESEFTKYEVGIKFLFSLHQAGAITLIDKAENNSN
jgi:hypothetical protein